jgi:hypothetical protein
MTEFVKEVEEEYRRAQIAAIFKKYGNIIIGGLLLVIIGIGGWQFLEWRQNQAARQGAVAFERALKLAGEEKGKEAEEAFVAIGKESGNPYAPLARFRSAAELARPEGI